MIDANSRIKFYARAIKVVGVDCEVIVCGTIKTEGNIINITVVKCLYEQLFPPKRSTMKSVVIISMSNMYFGNTAAIVRMNNYARALASNNLNVFLLSCDAFYSKAGFIQVEPHVFTNVQTKIKHYKGYNVFYALGVVIKMKRWLKQLDKEVAILNYSSTSSLLIDIIILLKLRKYPIFCEINEVRKFSSGSNNKTIRKMLYNFILEKTYNWYDGLVFISRNIKEYYSAQTHKSVIIPILSDCSKAFNLSKGINTLDFVFVGTVSFPKENLEELFEGFCLFAKEHPKARLKLYGILLQTDQKRLEDFIEKHDMKDRILYLGKLQHSEVDGLLSTAGALLLSRSNNKQNYYGFSTKLSEYAVSGTPIIMTNTGVVGDYFQDGTNCLMCEGYDRNAFKKKFDELAQMSVAEKQQMTENAYRIAQNHFDYRLYSESLKNFFFNQERQEKTI